MSSRKTLSHVVRKRVVLFLMRDMLLQFANEMGYVYFYHNPGFIYSAGVILKLFVLLQDYWLLLTLTD